MTMNLKVGLDRGLKETEEAEAEMQANIEVEEVVLIILVKVRQLTKVEVDLVLQASTIITRDQITKVLKIDEVALVVVENLITMHH